MRADSLSPPINGPPASHQLPKSSSTGVTDSGYGPNGTSQDTHPVRQQASDGQRSSTQQHADSADQAEHSSNFNDTNELHNPKPVHQNYSDYLQLQQEMAGTPGYQSFYFDDGSLNNFSHLDFYGNGLQGIPAGIYSTTSIANDMNQGNDQDARRFPPTPRDRPRTISRIGFVVPTTPHHRPPSAFVKSPAGEVPTTCRYLVLAPLMQHINHIISPTIACHLLDLYFAEPSSSLFESASPYVLSMHSLNSCVLSYALCFSQAQIAP